MRVRLAVLGTLALLLGAAVAPGPAGAADDLATVRGRIGASMAAAKSFVLATTAGGINGTMTFVAPDRYHTALSFSGNAYDVVIVGQTAYASVNGAAYQRLAAPPQFLATQTQLRDVPVDAVLPDTTVNGTTYGQFSTVSAGPQHDQRLTCTYDKSTYRVQRCTNPNVSIVFSRYDDPANAVGVPAPGSSPAR